MTERNIHPTRAGLRLPVVALIACLAWATMACKDSTSDETGGSAAFDRSAMLAHYADSLIVPAYDGWLAATQALHQQAEAFAASPAPNTRAELQRLWLEAVRAWQWAAPYDFGPANQPTGKLTQEVATFPADAAGIERYIAAGDNSLNNFDRATRGHYAIEYLIHGPEADKLATEANRRAYLLALTAHLQRLAQQTRSAWTTYRPLFVGNAGTDAGSSTTTLFNEFNVHYELLKNFKFGLPLGQRAGQTQAEPQRVEAYYSGQSLALAREHFRVTEHVYYGRTKRGTDGPGFDDYVRSTAGGAELLQQTETQLRVAQQALNTIADSPSLAEQIRANASQPQAAFQELLKLTRFFKSEISSRLGLAITYSSGDGD